jgi:hypothetical protein
LGEQPLRLAIATPPKKSRRFISLLAERDWKIRVRINVAPTVSVGNNIADGIGDNLGLPIRVSLDVEGGVFR